MSLAANEDGDFGAERIVPRTIRFNKLPRHPLDHGRGSSREIWAELDTDLSLRWQLRVVEIKDSTGLLVGPAGTHHYVVGLAGPQVAVRNTESTRVLRRDHVLPVLTATVHFERPKLRPPGASSLIVLTVTAAASQPGFIISTAEPDDDLGAGAQLVVPLRGTVRVDGAEAGPGSALLLDPAQHYRQSPAAAHLLTVYQPGSQPES